MGLFRILAALAAVSLEGLAHADVDALLGTSGRSDLVGPEVWTCTFTGAGGGSAAADLPAARDAWALPRPGLSGRLYVVNETSLGDALVPSVVELTPSNRVPLAFGAVRNRWTPSGMLSYYRSAADRALGDFPSLGGTVLKERKCITRDNVFVAELTVRNASAHPRRYDLSLVSKLTNGVWRFTTVSRAAKKERRASTAFGVNRELGEVEIPRNGELTFRYGAAFGEEEPSAVRAKLTAALGDAEVFEKNRRHVNGWFAEKVPAFDCDDVDLKRLYYYRWFVVYRALHEARRVIADHEYARIAAYESPCGSWYGCVIGLPVPMQIQEMSWMRDPQPARAQILGWVEKHPHYTDYIQFTPMTIWRNQLNHPDLALARQAFARVAPEPKGEAALPNQWGSWSTGAEYQPNFYQFTDPKWDWRHDCEMQKKGFEVAQLKRLDTAAYAIGNLLGGARIARLVGEEARAAALERRAEEMRQMILARQWDDRLGLFLAANPKDGRLADEAACYDSFAPYLWGIVSEPRYFRAFDKLADADWFGTDFAIPTVARNCPMYSSYNAIIGPTEASETNPHRYGCCWNGPVWHYADSLVAMAFGEAARREAKYRTGWLGFFDSWNETHFVFGDRTLMRAAEHFRAEDGVRFGQTADYFHSAWVDPFLRFWCGVGLAEDGKTAVFEPFARVSFALRNVPVGGVECDFTQDCREGRRQLTVRESGSGRILAKDVDRVVYSVPEPDRRRPQLNVPIVAHRGGAAESGLPDNSRAALGYAASLGCWASECDIYLTRDNEVVVAHADTECRINGLHPWEASLAEIRGAGKLSNGEEVPTFQDYLGLARKLGIRLLVDIKRVSRPVDNPSVAIGAARKVCGIVTGCGEAKRVFFICTSDERVMAGVLPYARAAGIQVGWMSDASPSFYRERGYEWGNLCAARHFKTRSPEEYLDAGIELSIFHLDRDGADVNAVWRDEDVGRFLSLGSRLKCITTNHPKWLRKRLVMYGKREFAERF